MIDISHKPDTDREAVAEGTLRMRRETLQRILAGKIEKGDVFAAARIAGIMGAKKTPDLIPLCHPLMLTGVRIHFIPSDSHIPEHESLVTVKILSTVTVSGKTGVEMEALTSVCIAGLTIYDMCKGIDPEMSLGAIGLVSKTGGRSGDYVRTAPIPSCLPHF